MGLLLGWFNDGRLMKPLSAFRGKKQPGRVMGRVHVLGHAAGTSKVHINSTRGRAGEGVRASGSPVAGESSALEGAGGGTPGSPPQSGVARGVQCFLRKLWDFETEAVFFFLLKYIYIYHGSKLLGRHPWGIPCRIQSLPEPPTRGRPPSHTSFLFPFAFGLGATEPAFQVGAVART